MGTKSNMRRISLVITDQLYATLMCARAARPDPNTSMNGCIEDWLWSCRAVQDVQQQLGVVRRERPVAPRTKKARRPLVKERLREELGIRRT